MVAIRWRGRRPHLGVAAFVFLVSISAPALAGDDDLALDLGSASDKPADAGTALRKLELRRIPRGTFLQGSPPSDPYREADEVPRTVTISKTFWMSKYPVTRAQFARFVAETRHRTDAEKSQNGGSGWDGSRLKQDKQYTWRNPGFVQTDDDPVTIVSFGDANAFTAWASRKTGRRVRLPTEAEYEYAARGGTTTTWYAATSEEEAASLGWFRPKPGSAVGTHPVGKKKPNPFGLYDMAGNVSEWCRDVYAVWPAEDVTDPENTTNATNGPERRVLRGGSWARDPKRARSAARYRATAGTRTADNGFRVVVEDAPVIAPAPGQASSADLAPSAAPPPPMVVDAGLAIQPTPVIQRPASSEGFAWPFFAAPLAAISFVVAWMLARRPKEATNAQGITTRAADDGFWVRAPNLPSGSRVKYTCIVKASEVSDIIPLDGGEETFVFTGGAPSRIHIMEAASVPGYRSSARLPAAAPSSRSPWPSDRGSVRSVGAIGASAPPPVPVVPPSVPSVSAPPVPSSVPSVSTPLAPPSVPSVAVPMPPSLPSVAVPMPPSSVSVVPPSAPSVSSVPSEPSSSPFLGYPSAYR